MAGLVDFPTPGPDDEWGQQLNDAIQGRLALRARAYGNLAVTSMGGASGSAFATKSHRFILFTPMNLVGVKAMVDTVAGASYRASLLLTDSSNGSVLQVVAQSDTLVIPNVTDAAGTCATVAVAFDTPVSLSAGVTYTLALSRTDGTATYALPLQNSASGSSLWSDFPGRFTRSLENYAATLPVVGTTRGSTGTGAWALLPVLTEPDS